MAGKKTKTPQNWRKNTTKFYKTNLFLFGKKSSVFSIFKLIIVFFIVLFFIFVIAGLSEEQAFNQGSSFFISNPELKSYKVEIDNGLKISYGTNYSITFIPYFVLNNGNVLTWNEIPSNIEKDLWKIKIQDNYYKYGISFDNLTTSQKNSIKYVVLHRSNSTGLNLTDVQIDNNTIIIKDKIYISHDDILSTYTIPIINKTDIVIGGLDRNWTECIEYNETEPFNCINETIKFNWILNGDGTWNISFDPTIFIAGGVTATINSPQNNSNFNVSSVTFNVTSNDTLSWCGVSINSSANVTMTNTSATAFNYTNSSIADGNYNFRITCNDTSNNYGNSGLNYFLIDTIIPTLNVTSPINSSNYNSSSILFNVSSSEEGTGSIIPDIDNSLVSWWRMDDVNATTGVTDYMGRNNGTAKGNATQTDAGKLGKGYSFDGINDYVDIGNTGKIINETFTLTAWIRPMGFHNNVYYGAIIAQDYMQYGTAVQEMDGAGLYVQRNDNRKAGLAIYGDGNQSARAQSQSALNLGEWYLVTGTYNTTDICLYLNGVLNSCTSIGFGFREDLDGTYRIGNNPEFDENRHDFNGTIDDVMIFNRSLSADEILSLYNATKLQHTETLNDGSHTFKAYTQDLAGNMNNSGVISFTTDTSYPTINFTSPTETNNSYLSRNYVLINVTSTDTNLANITINLYNSDNSLNQSNYSITSPFFRNYTSLADGIYYFNATSMDSVNNKNNTETRQITIDTINPQINLTYPLNITYNINVSALNYTVSDTNLQSCWYSINGGTTNTSVACGTNLTGLTSTEGSNTWLVGVNDSANNKNLSRVTFSKDTIYPLWNNNKTDLTSSTLLGSNVYFNITLNETNPSAYIFSFYNGTNWENTTNSYTNNQEVSINKTINIDIGNINWTWYINDSANNLNQTNVWSVNLVADDAIPPNVTINYPLNSSYSVSSINFNITALDNVRVSSCKYTLNNWVTNYTMTNSTSLSIYNHTNTSIGQGSYTARFWCNDTNNNLNNSESVNFTIDTIIPLISYGTGTSPDYSNLSQSNIYVNLSITEINFANMTFTLRNDTATINSTIFTISTYTINWTNLAQTNYTYFVNITDSANNKNSTAIRHITLDWGGSFGEIYWEKDSLLVLNHSDTNYTSFNNTDVSIQTIYIYNLTDALIYNGTDIINSSANIYDNDGNINISLGINKTVYVLNRFNLTEGVTRKNSPLWFSSKVYSGDTQIIYHLASNLTDTINTTVVLSTGTLCPTSIGYVSNSSVSYNANFSCSGGYTTINITNYEPAQSSNVLTVTYPPSGSTGGGSSGGSNLLCYEFKDDECIIKGSYELSCPFGLYSSYDSCITKNAIRLITSKEKKDIIKDFKGLIKNISNLIYPKNLFIGVLITLSLLILFIFSYEINKFFKKRKIKEREI